MTHAGDTGLTNCAQAGRHIYLDSVLPSESCALRPAEVPNGPPAHQPVPLRAQEQDRGLGPRYWAGIDRTGVQGDVLWDAGNDHELAGYREILQRHLDPGLPVVDIGCGHGSFTRALASFFPQVLGVDVSAHAVALATSESAGMENVSYLARDMTAPGAAAGLAGPTDANVFIRGVLHVLNRDDQAALVRNLREIVGARGGVFLVETNFQGNPVEYVTHLGGTTRAIPAPLERAIRVLPMPGHFGPTERARVMPPEAWELVEDGPATIEANPMTSAADASIIPGYYAVLKARH